MLDHLERTLGGEGKRHLSGPKGVRQLSPSVLAVVVCVYVVRLEYNLSPLRMVRFRPFHVE